MATDVRIRKLQFADIPSIANLLRDLAEEFITPEFDADARREFRKRHAEAALTRAGQIS